MCGGYSLIKDCYKTVVKRIAGWRNAHRPHGALGPSGTVIPERIINKPPSAQLGPNQTDESVLGSYDHLDAVLEHMIEGQNTPERAAVMATRDLRRAARSAAQALPRGTAGQNQAAGDALVAADSIEVQVSYTNRIARLVRGAQYKRRQAPPGVVLTGRDYGQGWRFPIAGTYRL
jgi:NAD+ synthase